jgi:hypothetical protein
MKWTTSKKSIGQLVLSSGSLQTKPGCVSKLSIITLVSPEQAFYLKKNYGEEREFSVVPHQSMILSSLKSQKLVS